MKLRMLLLLTMAFTLGGCGEKSPDPQAVAAEFFRQIAAGQTGAAYASTAEHFQLLKTQQYFEARVKDLQLDKGTVEWSPPEPVGESSHVMRVRGLLKRENARPLKLFATLTKMGDRWQVLEVRQEVAGAKKGGEDIFEVGFREPDLALEKSTTFLEPVQVTMPNQNQLCALVDKVMSDFNTGIQEKDFKVFFESTAERWRLRGKSKDVIIYNGPDPARKAAADPDNKDKRLTLYAIKTEFQPFVDQKIDLSPLLGKKIIIENEPKISSEGVLALEGHYADYFFVGAKNGAVAEPYMLSFKVEFFYENSAWRLFGFHPNIHSAKAPNK